MPLISPCGGGGAAGAAIYWAAFQDPSPAFVTSGVPRELQWHEFHTNDTSNVAIIFTGSSADRAILVSPDYIYTVWFSVYWPAFAGDRVAQLALTDDNPGWTYPVEVTNQETVQWIAGMVQLRLNSPTYLTATISQASGAQQNIQNATLYVQACQII